MFLALFLVFFVCWIFGFVVCHVARWPNTRLVDCGCDFELPDSIQLLRPRQAFLAGVVDR